MSQTRIDPASLPERYRAQIAASLGGGARAADSVAVRQDHPSEGRVMLRQSGAGMNKTEALFFAHLKATHPGAWIEREPMALKLGNGVRYNPDFMVHTELVIHADGRHELPQLTAYEVKGHMRDDAAVKLKVAARLFPFIRFVLVWRDRRAGTWATQEIFP
jgi:hypothetical protein